MGMVRVWNDNVYPYEETFKDQKIHIKPRTFIEMDEFEAIQFRGTYKSPVLNVDGVHLPEGFKMIRLEKVSADSPQVKVDDHQCTACKYKGSSKVDLDEHLKVHKEQALVDEEAEAELKARRKAKAS